MLRFLAAVLLLVFLHGAAQAEKRVALVIGNSSYTRIASLQNPRNDAESMATALKGVGFDVVSAINVDYRDMRRAVRTFGRKLRASGKDAVGLLYYAGHGVQARGSNYLIPLAAEIETTADLELEALSASNILAQMAEAGNRLNLVILDACRNNPFRGKVRSAGRGLARIQAASGTLIAFAAAPGQVAADGTGRNSPYTSALVEAIRQPGLTVEQLFKRVRVKVEGQTGGAQTPWEESSLRGEFFFVPGTVRQEKPVAASSPNLEALFWNSVKDSDDPALLQAYIDRYPNGTFSALAGIMIRNLEQKADDKAQSGSVANETGGTTQSAALQDGQTGGADQPGSVEEMVDLGGRYEVGNGVIRDPARAAHWYREASEKGDPAAKYRLGLLYYFGKGVPQNNDEAALQLLDSAKLNHLPAVETLSSGTVLADRGFLRSVQQRLKSLGHYRGRIDGRWGKASRQAVLAHAGLAVPSKPKSGPARTAPKKRETSNENVRQNRKPGAVTCPGSFAYNCF